MTEKRFTLTTTEFDGTLSFYDAEYDCETRMSTEYVLNSVETTLNALNDENQKLRNDNLKAFALLGTIRALLRLDDTKECIDKINNFEKEIME